MKRFTSQHEWIEVSGTNATIGISEHAANELGDITFVELPTVGTKLAQGDAFGVIESVKAASDIYSPAGGTVIEVNEILEEQPEIVNESPEKEGWICKLEDITESDLDDLMTEDEYDEFIQG